MSEIRIPLENHGPYGHRACVRVELVDGREGVEVTFDAEVDGDQAISRVLTPAEARALAASLTHYAFEAEL